MISKPSKSWVPLVSLLAGVTLHAQESIGSPSVVTDSPPVIDEVIVTAQRRDQDAQKVGITLSTIEYETLQRGLYQSLPDLAYSLPNIEMFEDFGGQGLPVWVIRGVGLQDFNANNTPTAAIYVDEVYQSSVAQGGSGVFDTERVEILKGPQGGLYGRNTSGGVVRQLTRRAELNAKDGFVSAATGSWGDRLWQGAINRPLGERVAVRVAGRVERSDDAWQTSLVSNSPHGKKDLWDMRSWWLVEPTARDRIEFKVYGGQNNSELPLARAIGVYSPDGGYCAAVLAGMRDDGNCLSYAGLVAAMNGEPDSVPYPSIQKRNGATSLSNDINRLDNRQFGGSLIATHDINSASLGPIQLQVIANYEEFDYGLSFDYDGSAAELGHQITASEIKSQAQELRLSSSGDSDMTWQAGLLLSRDEFIEDRQFRLRDNIPVGLVHGELDYVQVTRSQAAYVQSEYSLTDRWSVNAALRYTNEWKTYRDGRVTAPAFPPPYDVIVEDLNGDYQLGSRWSGGAGANWQIDDQTLWYATASKGFKSGGFFGGFIFERAEFASYKEETVRAYESGIKVQRADDRLRLNAAVFYYDYRDVQGFVNVETNPGGVSLVLERLATLGDAEHSGVDIDLVWLPSERITVTAAVGYLDARITSHAHTTINALGDVVSTGGRRAYAPRWSSSSIGAMHTQPLSANFVMQTGVSWHYRSELSGSFSSLVDEAVSAIPGYGIVDAYVTLSPLQGGLSLSLWGKNLSDKVYSPRKTYDSLGSYVEIMGQPRSWGIQARYDW